MRGLELCEAFYREYGEPLFEKEFKEQMPYLAFGLVGSGSECYGYDDEISKDHDFEAGFCIFLPEEDVIDRRTAFLLERAYARLPREYRGIKRSLLSPVGGNRHGVLRLSDFLTEKLGARDGELKTEAWLSIPEHYLCEVTNGKLFRDDSRVFTALRARLAHMPNDVRCKRLAGHLLLADQAGPYNYTRCLAHGEEGAAQIALFHFVEHMTASVFLLNRRYRPYYKWQMRALRALPRLSELADIFDFLLSTPNDEKTAREKAGIVSDSVALLIKELKEEGLSDGESPDLTAHAYAVNAKIFDPILRNRHILCAVSS